MTLEINEKHRLEENLKEKDSVIAALKKFLNETSADKQRLEDEFQAMKQEINRLKEKAEEDAKSLKESSFESVLSSQENRKPKPARKKTTKKAKAPKHNFDEDEIELLQSVTKKKLSNDVPISDSDTCLGFPATTNVSV